MKSIYNSTMDEMLLIMMFISGYLLYTQKVNYYYFIFCGCHGHNCMVVGFTTTYAISAYHHKRCEFEPCSWSGELDTTLCDKVCQ
jgi:hypothetical protein